MPVYSVLGNYLRARLISDLKEGLRRDPNVSVGAEFGSTVRKPAQVLVAVRSETHEQGAPTNELGVLYSMASVAEYPGGDWPGSLISWVSESPESEFLPGAGLYFVDAVPDQDNENYEITITPYFQDSIDFGYDPNRNPVVLPNSIDSSSEETLRVEERSFPEDPRHLSRGSHFSLDKANRLLTLTYGIDYEGAPYHASWWYWGETFGPFVVAPGDVRDDILPGLTLVFDAESPHSDRVIVSVGSERSSVADVYAGRWRVSVAVSVYAQSSVDAPRIASKVKTLLLDDLYDKYGTEGMSMRDLTSASSAEVEHDTPGEYTFKEEISFDLSVPWYSAKTYLIPLLAVSTVVEPPDHLNDLVAIRQEESRFLYTTKLISSIHRWDLDRVR